MNNTHPNDDKNQLGTDKISPPQRRIARNASQANKCGDKKGSIGGSVEEFCDIRRERVSSTDTLAPNDISWSHRFKHPFEANSKRAYATASDNKPCNKHQSRKSNSRKELLSTFGIFEFNSGSAFSATEKKIRTLPRK